MFIIFRYNNYKALLSHGRFQEGTDEIFSDDGLFKVTE